MNAIRKRGINMTEKHYELSKFVFTVTTVLLFGFFMLTSSQVSADNAYQGTYNKKEWQKQKEQNKEYRKHREKMERKDHRDYEKQGRHNYEKRPDYHKYSGYSERPYDKHRHYVEYDYKGHRYDYHGHWRSWEQWDRYRKKHPHIYEHGRYYHENAHLMFSFCEPGTSNCFFFSIGK
jgi:hypothetical protein